MKTNEAPKPPVYSALPFGKKKVCSDCFNAHPLINKGRGARMIAWLSGSEKKYKCCKCGRDCYKDGDDDR